MSAKMLQDQTRQTPIQNNTNFSKKRKIAPREGWKSKFAEEKKAKCKAVFQGCKTYKPCYVKSKFGSEEKTPSPKKFLGSMENHEKSHNLT